MNYYSWHKTSERLPEHGDWVWVAYKNFPNHVFLAKFSYDHRNLTKDYWLTPTDGIMQAPDYWHPLQPPNHPEISEGDE